MPDDNGQTWKFAVVNLAAQFGKPQKNLSRMAAWVERLAAMGAEVVAFPEMSICGYASNGAIQPYLESVPGPSTWAIHEMAVQFDVLILAGLGRKDATGKQYISQLAVSPQGLLAIYDKIFLSPKESLIFAPGEEPCVFNYRGWAIGMQLCYDTHFPELSAAQALGGADILFMAFASPHETPEGKYARWMRYLPARAYDNSCYSIACNLSGISPEVLSFPGVALALDPKGRLLGCVHNDQEEYLLVEFRKSDLNDIRQNPKAFFISHRKPIKCKGNHYV